jgi:hypothetical protein
MSLFQVQLNNTQQGRLDKNAYASVVNDQSVDHTGGTQFATSIQRTVWLTGPNNVKRELHDGDQFSDCNYYKRFCYPWCCGRTDQEKLQNAILTCVTDDGSVWIDGSGDTDGGNGGRGYSLAVPTVATITAEAASTYTTTGNAVVISSNGGYATFVQLTNTSGSHAVTIQLNGIAEAIFTLEANSTQHFSKEDLAITSVAVANTASGTGTVVVEVLYGVEPAVNS